MHTLKVLFSNVNKLTQIFGSITTYIVRLFNRSVVYFYREKKT